MVWDSNRAMSPGCPARGTLDRERSMSTHQRTSILSSAVEWQQPTLKTAGLCPIRRRGRTVFGAFRKQGRRRTGGGQLMLALAGGSAGNNKMPAGWGEQDAVEAGPARLPNDRIRLVAGQSAMWRFAQARNAPRVSPKRRAANGDPVFSRRRIPDSYSCTTVSSGGAGAASAFS